jgi:hypothetical protein
VSVLPSTSRGHFVAYYSDEQNDYYDRDYPLICRRSAPEMAEALGLPSAPNAGYKLVRDSVLADLCLAAEAGKALSYSRHKPWYQRSRYRPADFTYTNVIRVAAEIVDAGLALENRTAPGHLGRQSTLHATPALHSPRLMMDDPIYDPTPETIILRSRGEDRALISYDDTRLTRAMRNDVAAVNEMLASTVIGVPGGVRVGNHLLFERLVTNKWGELEVKRQYVRVVPGNGGRRIFSEKWSLHGRFYCWPQNIPSAVRATMTINGRPVSEPDFSAMHPLLLYNLLGKKLDGEAYDLNGDFDRKEVKIGTVIALNAKDDRTAVKALVRAMKISHARAAQIIEAIRKRHKPIESAICADMGITLMNLDSKITMAVTSGLMADGIPSIPVHDSIILPANFRPQAQAKMEEAWCTFSGKLNLCIIR